MAEVVDRIEKIPKSRSSATLPKKRRTFRERGATSKKAKRQSEKDCLLRKPLCCDDGAGNEIRKERSDGIAERSEASRFRCNEVSRGKERAVIFLVKIKGR